jgi:hypothetical protein
MSSPLPLTLTRAGMGALPSSILSRGKRVSIRNRNARMAYARGKAVLLQVITIIAERCDESDGDVESRLLCQCAERADDGGFLHILVFIEL